MIGLTMVAFGTSLPELVLNEVAVSDFSTQGPPLAWGNIIGSNMANIGLVLAIACLIRPISAPSMVLRRDLPLLLVITVLAVVLLWDGLTVVKGYILMAGFLIGMLIWFWTANMSKVAVHDSTPSEPARKSLLHQIFMGKPTQLRSGFAASIIGIVVLGLCSEEAVEKAVTLAVTWKVTETIIGVSIVAIATSLPELFTVLIAMSRNEPDMALGTVVGSNFFNLALVMGLTATIANIPMPEYSYLTLFIMLSFTLSLCLAYIRPLGKLWAVSCLLAWIVTLASMIPNHSL
jgi:cation:H+ antiporter